MFVPYFYQMPWWWMLGLAVVLAWTIFWKGLGMWHAARNKQKYWFIAMLVLNTAGLLPIIYLLWFKPERKR